MNNFMENMEQTASVRNIELIRIRLVKDPPTPPDSDNSVPPKSYLSPRPDASGMLLSTQVTTVMKGVGSSQRNSSKLGIGQDGQLMVGCRVPVLRVPSEGMD